MAATLKRPDEIQDILNLACMRNELLILVTPFLRFESYFVTAAKGELQVAATMSREDATFGLRSAELKIRFPMGLGFMEAPVQLLGLGLHEGRRTLRLSLPRQLQDNDHRSEYRVERVGRVSVTYGTPKGAIFDASLVDLSTRGARIHIQMDVATLAQQMVPMGLQLGTILVLSIPLSEDIRIEARGKVRHMGARNIGLEFTPQLPDAVQVPLSRWVFQRREEDQERLAQRAEVNLKDRRARTGEQPSGILFVSAEPELEEDLRSVLQPVQPLTRIGLTAQALKDAMARVPSLVIFQVNITKLDERRRIRALVELVAGRAPVLLLGTDVEGPPLFELSKEWKTASAINWNPSRAAFLQRLAQGIIRRYNQGGDAPLAPAEPQ